MSNGRPTPDSLKEKAKRITKFMKEKYDVDVSHGHGLELISQVFGYKDWNTASAATKANAESSILPRKITTVGELKEALGKFNDDDGVDADYEFKLVDFIKNYDDWGMTDEIHQNFSLSLVQDIEELATFKLKLEVEDISIDDGQRITGWTVRTGDDNE